MKRPLLLAVLLVTVIASVGAAATPTPTATPTEPSATEAGGSVIAIDGTTEVLSYRYDAEAGVMVVRLQADTITQLTVSDVYGAIEESGGAQRIPSKSMTLAPGESTIRVEAVPSDGKAVVTLSTADGAVALTARTSEPLIGGTPTWGDVRLGTLLGGAAGLAAVVFAAYYRELGRGGDVERGPL